MDKIIKPNIANIQIRVKDNFIFIIEQLLLPTTPAAWHTGLKVQNISRQDRKGEEREDREGKIIWGPALCGLCEHLCGLGVEPLLLIFLLF